MLAQDPAEEARDVPPLLDELRLATLSEALGDGLADMAAVFPEAVTEELSSLADALARGDAGRAAAAAHSLKGMAANFGAERLRRLAADMELACGSPGAADLLAEIERVADRTSAALLARLAGEPAP